MTLPKPTERQLSDIESVQAPVQDNSAATRISAFTQGVQGLASGVNSVVIAKREHEKAGAEREEEALFNTAYSFLDTTGYAVSSGQMTNAQRNQEILKFSREWQSAGHSAELWADVNVKQGKTLLGRALKEGDSQDKAQKQRFEAFSKTSYYRANGTTEENEDGMAAYEADLIADEELENARGLWDIQAQRDKGNKAAYDKNKKVHDKAVVKNFNKKSLQLPALYSNSINDLKEARDRRIVEGLSAPESNTQYLQELEQSYQAHKYQIRNLDNNEETDLTSQRESADATLDGIYDVAKKFAGKTEENVQLAAAGKNSILKAELAVIHSEQGTTLVNGAAINNIFQGSVGFSALSGAKSAANAFIAGSLQEEADRKAAIIALGQSLDREDGKQAPNFKPDAPGAVQTFDLIKTNVVQANAGTGVYEGNPEAVVDLVKQVRGVMGYVNQATGFEESLAVIDNSLQMLASEGMGEFIKSNVDDFDGKDYRNVQESLTSYGSRFRDSAEKVLQGVLSSKQADDLAKTSPASFLNPFDRSGSKMRGLIATQEEIEISFTTGRAVFVGSTEGARVAAEKLNKKLSTPLTTYIRANAAVSTASPQAIFNEYKATFWPSKYGESEVTTIGDSQKPEPGETTEAAEVDNSPTATQDLSALTAGQVIIDEQGNRFTANGDGTLTQIRSAPNAASR